LKPTNYNQEPTVNRPIAKPIFIAVLSALILTGCGKQQTEPSASTSANSVKAHIISVNTSNSTIVASSPASVVAEQQAEIASRIMGFIREINVEVGQKVSAGQRLFRIDPSDIQGQVSQANAGLAQAQAALADAKNDYERFGTLYKEEAIPKVQWDKIRLQYQVAQQQFAAAKAGQGTAGSQMNYATPTAPFAGVITQKLSNVGDLASPGRPILVMENPAKLVVQTQVPEDIFTHIQIGTPVTLHIDSTNTNITGKVAHLVTAADPISHTHLVKISLPEGHGLQSGMFIQASFPMGQAAGLSIPASAVLNRAGITGVFVVDKQGIAHYRMVRVGDTLNNMTTIQAGLNNGEQIVTSNTDHLQSGDKVINTGVGNV
jgi:RND family efflux transporter MFP subunit